MYCVIMENRTSATRAFIWNSLDWAYERRDSTRYMVPYCNTDTIFHINLNMKTGISTLLLANGASYKMDNIPTSKLKLRLYVVVLSQNSIEIMSFNIQKMKWRWIVAVNCVLSGCISSSSFILFLLLFII